MKKDGKLSTEPYKGVRDFYPEDMVVQRYIFDTWAHVAESFGFERYDASVLEPSELYKSKGAENEEMVNEQTYTFMDRGDREVTLRPEMTPTVARMVAGKRRGLSFPIRWYSIPNLFRYERTQRGRVREHWQLNADIFGSNDTAADVEIILLASSIMKAFGATDADFAILINDRAEMRSLYASLGITDDETITKITRLNDRKKKISADEYRIALLEIVTSDAMADAVIRMVNETAHANKVVHALEDLGVTNVSIDRSLARGFDYYTGTIFEIFDTHEDNRRSLLGGGRYDNLTGLFGGDPIPAVGFGMGDVTMRDFLETHNLLPQNLRGVDMVIIPQNTTLIETSERIAHRFRTFGYSVYTSLKDQKIGDHIRAAAARGTKFMIVVGDRELETNTFTARDLRDGKELTGTIEELFYMDF